MKYFFVLILVTACTSIVTPPSKIAVDTLSPVTQEAPAHAVSFPPVEINKATRMVYSSSSSLSWVKQLSEKANCIINNQAFLAEVASFNKFTFTDSSPAQVAEALRSLGSVKVATYKTRNPYSKAIATTYSTDRETVYLNTRRNPRPMADMVNTLIHEGLHLAGFSHGDNSPKGKEDSVNYRVGAIAEKYVDTCN